MHTAISQAKNEIQAAVDHLKHAFSQIQAGRASTALVEDLMVESYGSMMSLKSVATINTPDASTIVIQPWDKSLVSAIEKTIQTSPLGLNPQVNGLSLLIPIPKPTEEKRKSLVKTLKQITEDSKVTLRNIRHEALAKLKQEKEDGVLPEDQFFGLEKDLQKVIDDSNKMLDDLADKKSQEIMTI